MGLPAAENIRADRPSCDSDDRLGEIAERSAKIARTNRGGLRSLQPNLNVGDSFPAGEPCLARDGTLTFRTTEGHWLAGTSLPSRAAERQLETLHVAGPVACFLDPPHASHLRSALDRLGPAQALIALVLDSERMPHLLACQDFQNDLADHRLWFVAGADWPLQMRELFEARPGLSTPTQFVRLNLPDSARLDPVIAEAQRLFGEVSAERSQRVGALQRAWRKPDRTRWCVLTSRRFSLDSAAGAALDFAVRESGPDYARALAIDDPLTTSTWVAAERAATCGRVLSADVGRADLPAFLPNDLPWTTWVTQPRIPAAVAGCSQDRLLLTDTGWRTAAAAAGWSEPQVSVALWPARLAPAETAEMADPTFALFADVPSLQPPERLDDYSSHRLLWNSILEELDQHPGAARQNADAFLDERLRRFGVSDESLDRRLFIFGLIWPATIVSTARRLLAGGAPLKLFGKGWEEHSGCIASAAGPIHDYGELIDKASSAAAVIDARPASWEGAAAQLGSRVIQTSCRPIGKTLADLKVWGTCGRSAQFRNHRLSLQSLS